MVSVIMPAYNAESTIKYAINSVILQSYEKWELLVIDDGSADRTGEIVMGIEDPRIKLFFQRNRGPSSARNLGIDNASGDYITFMDADDIIHKDYLKILIQNAELFNSDITMCDYEKVKREKLTTKADFQRSREGGDDVVILNSNSSIKNMLYKRNVMPYPFLKLVKKQTIGAERFSEKLKLGEDLDFNWRIFENAEVIVYVNKILYFHIDTEGSITHSFSDEAILNHFMDLEQKLLITDAEIRDAVICRMFVLAFDTLAQISSVSYLNDNNCSAELYEQFIRDYKNQIINNKETPVVVKIMGIMANISIPMTVYICKLLKKSHFRKAI